MDIGTRVDAGIRESCEADPCSPDQADKSGGHRDDSCKITLFDAQICWLRTIHRHTASEAFHYPTNMSPMICQANSRRVPIDRKLGTYGIAHAQLSFERFVDSISCGVGRPMKHFSALYD